ncbi:MAG: hypothetical protein QE269_06885 [Fimbriimonas sp.]|nr:hypothetical protein [Fimbriimonas sp.]
MGFKFAGNIAGIMTLFVIAACGGGSGMSELQMTESSFASPSSQIVGPANNTYLRLNTISTPRILEEVSLSDGSVLRQVQVSDSANSFHISQDRSQVYVYAVRGTGANPNDIQRVNISSFAVEATYSVPAPAGTYLENVVSNPKDPLEVSVLARIPASRFVSLGPVVYRNDALLPDQPDPASHNGRLLDYISPSVLLVREGGSSSDQLTLFSVTSAGASFNSQSTDADPFEDRPFVNLGGQLVGENGKVLLARDLSVVRSIVPSVSYASFDSIVDRSGDIVWIFVTGTDGGLNVEAQSFGSGATIAAKQIMLTSGERVFRKSVVSPDVALIQTSDRMIVIRLG